MAGQWRTDPFGRHQQRFHDGVRWTATVADHGVVANDPPPADMAGTALPPPQPVSAASAATKPKRPWSTRQRVVASGAVVVVAVLGWFLFIRDDASTRTELCSALRASDDEFNDDDGIWDPGFNEAAQRLANIARRFEANTEVQRAGRTLHEMLNGELVLIETYEYDATVWPIRGQCGYELD